VNQATNFSGVCGVKCNDEIIQGAKCTFDPKNGALGLIKDISIAKKGVYKIEVFESEGKIKPYSFYIKCDENAQKICFGDIHGHTGLMDGTGTAFEYYKYARDVAFLDFCCLSEHIDSYSDGRQASNSHQWQEVMDATKAFNKPDKFATILGYENSAKSDINIYFRGGKAPWYADSYPPEIFKFAKKHDALVIPHMTTYAQFLRGFDWAHYDAKVVPAIEIYSNHGASERFGGEKPLMDCEPGGYALDALNRGYKIGFIASGDGHNGMPGNALWHKYINGLVAVFVDGNERNEILSAIKNRKCYATTNERIIGEFSVNGQTMGSIFDVMKNTEIVIDVKFYGTCEIDYVDIILNGDTLMHKNGKGKDRVCFSKNIKLKSNAEFGHNYIYVRMKQKDDNMVWLSPVYITIV